MKSQYSMCLRSFGIDPIDLYHVNLIRLLSQFCTEQKTHSESDWTKSLDFQFMLSECQCPSNPSLIWNEKNTISCWVSVNPRWFQQKIWWKKQSETNRLCSMFLLGCALLWCDPTTMPYERGKWMTDANTTTTPRDECSMYLRWKSLQDVNWHFYRGRNNKFNRAKYGAVWFQFFFCFALHNRSSSNSWIRFLRWNFFYFFSAFFFSGEFFSYEFFSTMIRFF